MNCSRVGVYIYLRGAYGPQFAIPRRFYSRRRQKYEDKAYFKMYSKHDSMLSSRIRLVLWMAEINAILTEWFDFHQVESVSGHAHHNSRPTSRHLFVSLCIHRMGGKNNCWRPSGVHKPQHKGETRQEMVCRINKCHALVACDENALRMKLRWRSKWWLTLHKL